MLRPERLLILLPTLFLTFVAAQSSSVGLFLIGFGFAVAYLWVTWKESIGKRFINPRFAERWAGCQDRLTRFEQVLSKLRKDDIADLKEMPATIRQVGQSVYIALRKADIIAQEVHDSELGLSEAPATWTPGTTDAQSQALYQVADRNVAEYRRQLNAVLAGVHRAEAQSAVYMTTLDSLRIKMQGYRLVGRRPELPSQEFLESLAEARLQLESIDHALEELDLGHYPKQISVVPPLPSDAFTRVREEAPQITDSAR